MHIKSEKTTPKTTGGYWESGRCLQRYNWSPNSWLRKSSPKLQISSGVQIAVVLGFAHIQFVRTLVRSRFFLFLLLTAEYLNYLVRYVSKSLGIWIPFDDWNANMSITDNALTHGFNGSISIVHCASQYMWHGRNGVLKFNELKLTRGVTLRLRAPNSNMFIDYSG
jgi:hypothetical protein